MNKKQQTELIKLIVDFLIDAKHLYDIEKYSLKAYSNETSTKIPITFKSQNKWLDNLTVDYFKQEVLEECGGYNMVENYILLGCELEKMQEFGEIRYYHDQSLTDILNEAFARH